MTAALAAGYPYEIAGLVFYVFFLYMVRKRTGPRYSQRTRILTIAAAIALVGTVPFHYAANGLAMGTATFLALAALTAAFIDARAR